MYFSYQIQNIQLIEVSNFNILIQLMLVIHFYQF